MSRISRLAAPMATAIALAALVGTSAFAEERHQNTTDGQAADEVVHRDRQWRNRDQQQNTQQQQFDRRDRRDRGNENENQNRNWDRGTRENQQQYDRNRNWDRG